MLPRRHPLPAPPLGLDGFLRLCSMVFTPADLRPTGSAILAHLLQCSKQIPSPEGNQMIYGIPPMLISPIDSDKTNSGPVIANGQGNAFLNLLIRTVAKSGGKTMPRSAGTDPQALRNYPPIEISPLSSGEDPTTKEIFRIVFKHEGSAYVAKDGGKEASKYGILQGTANRYGFQGDVRNMSRAQAEAIYKKIWSESGAEKLPRNLALVHFDTYINSPAAAKKMLKSSGGHTETYLELRSERYARLSRLKPGRYAKYMKGWMNRIENLRALVAENAAGPSMRSST